MVLVLLVLVGFQSVFFGDVVFEQFVCIVGDELFREFVDVVYEIFMVLCIDLLYGFCFEYVLLWELVNFKFGVYGGN